MKRRGFLQALGGAVAAAFAPAVVASKTAASFADKYQFAEYRLSILIKPPETVSELRNLIESTYETVGYIQPPIADVMMEGFGAAQTPAKDAQRYRALHIMGVGKNEREAVADAFKTVAHEIGGKELLWRRRLSLDVLRDFEEGTNKYVVRGRAAVSP